MMTETTQTTKRADRAGRPAAMSPPAVSCSSCTVTTSGGWSRPGSTAALTSRVDASDVVQDTLTDAAGQLDEYLRDQPLPFLPWLRQLAGERIRKTHRRHLVGAKSQRHAGDGRTR